MVFGFANFLIIFNALPLIPSLFLFDLIYLFKTKKIKQFLLGFLLPTIILFLFISPFDWFRETVFYNLKYAAPQISLIKNNLDYLRLLFFPFLAFAKGDNSIFNQYLQLFCLVLIVNLIFFLFFIKRIREFFSFTFLFLIIIFLNNRVLAPGKMYYDGFHLLPWYAAFIFFNLLTIKYIFMKTKRWIKWIPFFILFGGGTYLLAQPSMPYFTQVNKDWEHNVNFSSYAFTGMAIESIADEDDRLAVFPHESLLYWQSGLRPATRQIAYYEWEYDVPLLKKQLDEVFITNPPEFIYWNAEQVGPASYLPLIEPLLENDYWWVSKEEVPQKLFIKNEKIKEVSQNQWERWQGLGFDRVKRD